jgi:hypothetical protein
MPFKSNKQRAYLYSQKPEVAKKFEEHSGKSLKDKLSGLKIKSKLGAYLNGK